MRYARLENNTVIDLVGNDPFKLFQPPYAEQFIECPEEVQYHWTFDGKYWLPPVPPVPTQEEREDELQSKLNAFAREKGFDTIEDACSYVNSTNTEWAAEARRAIEVRDVAWGEFYESGEMVVLEW